MSSVGPRSVGKYRLLTQLGSGGMADVYLGVDEHLAVAKLVVVKRVRSHLADDAEFRALLLEEARVCARLNHPNIVQVLDVGFEDAECYLAMEYLDGQSLSSVVKHAGDKLPAEAELLIVCDVLRALNYAHDLADFDGTPLSIVHRDVSPQNIFITYDGAVKLLDFGIAKAAGRATETREGFMRGKLRYMAPEILRGLTIDRRVDVFAAGILVWQALTDRRFWAGETLDADVMRKLARHEYDPSPRSFNPDVSDDLDRICRRALAGHPSDRYPTAGAMLADLEDYLGNRVVDLRRALVAAMKETFEEDRQKRRAVIEEAGATTSIATTLGSIAMRAARSSDSFGVQPLVSGPPSTRSDFADETRSLANMLEPSMTRPRRHWRARVGAVVTFVALAVAAVAFVFVGPHRTTAAAREPASRADDKLEVAHASDDVIALAAGRPIASDSTFPSAKASPPSPPPNRRRTQVHSRRAANTAPDVGAGTSPKPASTKPIVDTSDPWH